MHVAHAGAAVPSSLGTAPAVHEPQQVAAATAAREPPNRKTVALTKPRGIAIPAAHEDSSRSRCPRDRSQNPGGVLEPGPREENGI